MLVSTRWGTAPRRGHCGLRIPLAWEEGSGEGLYTLGAGNDSATLRGNVDARNGLVMASELLFEFEAVARVCV